MRHPRIALILAVLCALPVAAAAQQASIQGLVTSERTGAPLEGVTIALQAADARRYGAVTDRNGFYQIGGIAPGAYTLRGTMVGHVEHQRPVTIAPGARLTVTFALAADVVSIEGVVGAARSGATVRELGRQRVTPADIGLVPTPAGTGDLASYLQTLPGVVTTGDRGGQLFVRGGTAAENLVLVDGIPIYQPFHIVGFFSVFPEDLVSSADFYAGGFGARYTGRTSSVLDVGLRDGDMNSYRGVASVSPFVTEALAEGPLGTGVSWLASVRRSVVEETSKALTGERQPLAFDSQLLKLTMTEGDDLRCSVLALRSSDRGRLDPDETQSRVAWQNALVGGRCVTQFENFLRLVEVNFSASSVENTAVSRGSSAFESRILKIQHDAHVTSMVRSIPVYAGYHLYTEGSTYDLTELLGGQPGDDGLFGLDAYLEAGVPVGSRVEVRPGVALAAAPRAGVEPRLRARWEPLGRSSEAVQGAVGLYRQQIAGITDMRDVGSVFTAWTAAPDGIPLESLHAMLGWQQSLSFGLRWSLEGYYKRMSDIPVPTWQAMARFNTRLGRAEGESYGVDARVEYASPGFHTFVGYGYASTSYEMEQAEFGEWFGSPVQRFHPPHDRRHQVNAVATLDVAGFQASVRWQLGSGLPFTRPLGFDETFDYTINIHDVSANPGVTRLLVDRPFTGRLPVMHRLDVSLERDFHLPIGRLTAQVGAVNAYDRRNMFYYDLYTGRRVDQLPLSPYGSITIRAE
jgi:hypothetical protein